MPSSSVTPVPPSAFAELGAHSALAAALSARGYAAPTPVQAAVLGAGVHDLLVSSQTGSGKTVAFGLLIARVLLGDEARLRHAAPSQPRTLVIAPTRELAAQVQRELGWLFADTGARVVAFTGGTDLRLDSRALKRGVDIAVGTPGRLVDLVERKSLILDAIEVVVLDEADEMLDLGFRESLELLLERAPKERRTLLFSATLPSGIRALAARYQTDARSLDPRAGQASTGHEDIQHVAHLCRNGERKKALVNVLRLADEDRALVFCRTREDVSELHRDLIAHGFRAAAISGERAQAERTRALDALRDGRAKVLVATNVAARGLDLPDLGLVIHADVPENAESLTHRSGRTGRAGKKGVNILLVEERERKKAERLFNEARLRLRWTPPPGANAVAERDRQRVAESIRAALEGGGASPAANVLAEELLATQPAIAVVAALLDRALGEQSPGEELGIVELAPARGEYPSAAGPRRVDGPMVQFTINLGTRDRAQPNWILPMVCRRGNVTKREIGAIRVGPDRTWFEILASAAPAFAAAAAEPDLRNPQISIQRAEGPAPATSAPPRRPGRPGGPPRPGARPTFGPRPTGGPRPAGGAKPPRRK